MGQSYVLVAVETAHIQSYIFASNRLKENVGASYLVAVATREWAFETLSSQGLRTNLTFMNNERGFSNQRIEENQLDAEVLYSGGGNIVILFSEASETVIEPNKLPEAAISRKFIRILSRRIQLEAPGLTLTFSAHPFKWEDSLSKAVSTILRDMTYQRNYQTAAYGEGGQSVQMMDSSTGLPAITMQKETRSPDDERPNPWQPYGAETVAKRDSAEPANKLLRSQLQLEQTEYRFALDLDDLGRSKDDTSYIAVVHADGNGLGRLIQGLQEDFPAPKNRKYIEYMRWFSESVRKVAQAAQQEMAAQLLKSIKHSDGRYYLEVLGRKTKEIFLFERDGKPIFPLRPLVSGGDDVTFVCDGRIALDLAVIFLKAFEKYSIEILKRPLTACAGIAIVKTHYPFARAYELAEELASEAKQARHLLDENNAPSAMDWHITAGGLYGDLDMMRKREY